MTTPLTLPVTVSATRRPQPGAAIELQAWAAGLGRAATDSGAVGSYVTTGPSGVTTTVVFPDAVTAAAWERSSARTALLDRAEPLTDGAPSAATTTPGAPPRWRTALVVWAGLFPFSLLFTVIAGPVVAALLPLMQSLVTSAVLVPLTVYLGIPTVNALLRGRR